MSITSALKCLFCLVKCSKYLYFIKKAVCITAISIAVIAGFSLISGNNSLMKKFKEMI